MATFIDNISDLRYNPFAQIFTAYGYGYSGNDKEVQTIPSTSPYYVYLNEIPRDDTPSTLFINEQGGGSFTEVSFSTSPAAGQFRVVYGGDGTTTIATAGQGIVEFNSSDAGKTIEIQYYGLGYIMQKQLIDNILKVANPLGTIIPVHPDTKTAYLPDSEYWAACDGSTLLNTTYFNTGNDTFVPDLTDDRFLMGDTTYNSAGSNTIDFEHNHQWYDRGGGSSGAAIRAEGGYSGDQQGATYNSSGSSIDIQGTGYLSLDSYTTNVLSSSQDIRPQYFSVLYYMRIN